MSTRVCAISFKECWQDEAGHWYTDGGFPLQMAAIASLFDAMTLMITRRATPGRGGTRLPVGCDIVVLRRPLGQDDRRKASVVAHLPYYMATMARHVRDADAVHVPLPGDIAFLGMLTALFLQKPLIARYCGSWVPNAQTTPMNRVTCALMRRFAGGRNVMLATGAGQQPPAANMGWVFATALSQSDLHSVAPDFDRDLSHPARLAYVGRLSREKGVVDLIAALGRLRTSPGAGVLPHLTIIGDGPQREELAALAAKACPAEQICFTGQIPHAEVLKVLRGSDLCVLPSLTESFCKARLDAMLCGAPVITTAVGFGREIVGADGERGWLVPSRDSAALATLLSRLLTEPRDWPALRRRCRQYVEGCTLEAWSQHIGQRCAQQWRMALVEGKLRT